MLRHGHKQGAGGMAWHGDGFGGAGLAAGSSGSPARRRGRATAAREAEPLPMVAGGRRTVTEGGERREGEEQGLDGRWARRRGEEQRQPGLELAEGKGGARGSSEAASSREGRDEEKRGSRGSDAGQELGPELEAPGEDGAAPGGGDRMAAGGGRVCVLADCGKKVVVVDVTTPNPTTRRGSTSTAPPRMWEVEAPGGRRVVSLHVLPRMTRPE